MPINELHLVRSWTLVNVFNKLLLLVSKDNELWLFKNSQSTGSLLSVCGCSVICTECTQSLSSLHEIQSSQAILPPLILTWFWWQWSTPSHYSSCCVFLHSINHVMLYVFYVAINLMSLECVNSMKTGTLSLVQCLAYNKYLLDLKWITF